MAPPTTMSKRVKNVSISRPIIYGNISKKISETNPLPAGAPADHTHTWKIFLKDPMGKDEELSKFIKKIVFKLHDTYNNSTRSIEAPPYEVEETGWGEFEIGIKIYFISESSEKNITLYHHLKLHPYKEADIAKGNVDIVESVMYDEIVFNEPTEKMFTILTTNPSSLLPYDEKEVKAKGINKDLTNSFFTKKMEAEELSNISSKLEVAAKELAVQQKLLLNLENEKKKLLS